LWAAMGRTDEAVMLSRQVLDARVRTLGAQHLETMVSQNNLGLLMQKIGKLEDAARLFNAACSAAAESLPPADYATALFRGNYGRCLVALERYQEAKELLEASSTGLKNTFGEKDARTQRDMRDLAGVYDRLGDKQSAERLRAMLPASQPASATQPSSTS